ncbi:hypothetical protein ACFL1E_04195 [Candidatus Omnitrophota bacterium]
MNPKPKRRLFFIANEYQERVIKLVFYTTVVPVIITIVALCYLFFDITTNLMLGGYESIPLVKKIIIGAIIILPCYIVLLGIWSYKISNRLTGPITRINSDLQDVLDGKTQARLRVRDTDYLKDIVDKINVLIDRIS